MKNKNNLKKKMKKWSKWAVIAIFIAALVFSYIYEQTRPLEVESYKVERRDISDSFTEEGIVEASDETDIYSLVSGEIKTLGVKEGQRVKKGKLIVELDTSELAYNISQLKGQLRSITGQQNADIQTGKEEALQSQALEVENARKEYEDAIRAYERASGLYEQEAVSREEIEGLQKDMEVLENKFKQQEESLAALKKRYEDPSASLLYFQGQKESVRAQINVLEHRMTKSRIYAAYDGTIKSVNVDKGQYVSPGTSICELMGAEGIEIKSRVLAEDVVDLKEGMRVEAVLEHDPQDFVFEGNIKRINPYASESVSAIGLVERRVDVVIGVSGDGSLLRPGYTLDVDFIKRKSEDAIAIPKRAIFNYKGEDSIWKIVSERARIQKVDVEYETEDYSVISSGLSEGDIVILNHKTEGLDIGKRVEPVY